MKFTTVYIAALIAGALAIPNPAKLASRDLPTPCHDAFEDLECQVALGNLPRDFGVQRRQTNPFDPVVVCKLNPNYPPCQNLASTQPSDTTSDSELSPDAINQLNQVCIDYPNSTACDLAQQALMDLLANLTPGPIPTKEQEARCWANPIPCAKYGWENLS